MKRIKILTVVMFVAFAFFLTGCKTFNPLSGVTGVKKKEVDPHYHAIKGDGMGSIAGPQGGLMSDDETIGNYHSRLLLQQEVRRTVLQKVKTDLLESLGVSMDKKGVLNCNVANRDAKKSQLDIANHQDNEILRNLQNYENAVKLYMMEIDKQLEENRANMNLTENDLRKLKRKSSVTKLDILKNKEIVPVIPDANAEYQKAKLGAYQDVIKKVKEVKVKPVK